MVKFRYHQKTLEDTVGKILFTDNLTRHRFCTTHGRVEFGDSNEYRQFVSSLKTAKRALSRMFRMSMK